MIEASESSDFALRKITSFESDPLMYRNQVPTNGLHLNSQFFPKHFSATTDRLVRPVVRNQFSVLNSNFIVAPPFDNASINQVRGRRWSLLRHLANGLNQ